MTSLVWLRDDLRLADNPALRAAVDRDEPVDVLYVLDETSPGIRPLGGAAKWWLHRSLTTLGERINDRGGRLILRRGAAADRVPEVAAATGADHVFWNRRYGGPERDVDRALKVALRDGGLEVTSKAGSLLFEPWTIRTGSGDPYRVYTPFWKACQQAPAPRAPLAEPRTIDGGTADVTSDDIASWDLLPSHPDWSEGIAERWEPGELAARQRLREFLETDIHHYDSARDEPAAGATSELSPRLRWGELSPYTVWHDALSADADPGTFLSEIGWREFAWHVLFHAPDLHTTNLNRRFDAFPWPRLKPTLLEAWQQGKTGYGLVDAGMRELWHSGVMHNRVRMVTASFLTKNLLIDWRRGEEWFWDCLVDADAANNPFNWQWVAGSGADAAPYFRVFNPETQREKFDGTGAYVKQWAPEYAGEGDAPEPVVDLQESRKQALDAYETVRRS